MRLEAYAANPNCLQAIYTMDLTHGRIADGVTIVNPFL